MMFDLEEAFFNPDRFVRFTRDLFKLRPDPKSRDLSAQICFLKNHWNAAGWFYGEGLAYLTVSIRRESESHGSIFLLVHSIDDGSIPVFGPSEPFSGAENRLSRVIEQIESWDGWIPSPDQLRKLERECGMFWNA